MVQLLSESYNPHVRYGAAMALGIACAGTGNKDALALIEPMNNDPVNYVRQVRIRSRDDEAHTVLYFDLGGGGYISSMMRIQII